MSDMRSSRGGTASAPLRRPSVFAANALFLVASAGLLLVGLAAEPFQRWLAARAPGLSADALLFIVNALYYIPFLAVPALAYAARRPGVADAMRLKPMTFRCAIAAVLAAMAGVMAATCLTIFWSIFLQKIGLNLFYAQSYVPDTPAGLTLYVFTGCVLPGVCEELLFRGAVLSAWERRGTRLAVVASTLLFSGLHGSLEGLPTQLLLGAVIAWIVVASDSLYAGMAYHTSHNALLILINYLSANGAFGGETAQDAALAQRDLAAYYGGAGALAELFFTFLLYAAMLGGMLLIFTRRAKAYGIELAPDSGKKMSAPEMLVLLAGLGTVALLYLQNIMNLMGVAA